MPTRATHPRRSPFLAPAAVGVAGLVAGGGLVAVLLADEGESVRSTTPTTVSTSPPSTPATEPEVITTTTLAEVGPPPTTGVAEGPLRESAARLDGDVFLETAQCIAFPISNPDAGVGDAHINVSLHRVESTDGRRMIVERWTEDGTSLIGVVEPGVRRGRVFLGDVAATATGESVIAAVPMDDGSSVELEHTLSTGGSMCATTLVTGDDDFAFVSLGMIDLCQASEASGLGAIATHQNGSMLQFADDVAGESSSGRYRIVADDGTVSTGDWSGSWEFAESGQVIAGTLTPSVTGASGDVDTIRLPISGTPTSPACLPSQEAAFTP